MNHFNSGGFMPQVPLPSPSPSTASTVTPGELPRPREHPLKPGSQKEIAFVNFVDSKMLNITRRYAKKFSSEGGGGGGGGEGMVGKGYERFGEVVGDLEGVFDVVWVSGTPTLQTPYFLSLASTFVSYLPAFPFSAKATIRMVRKLDRAFTYLLQLDDSITLSSLHKSSFPVSQRKIVSRTDRVRIRSVCELTRVSVVECKGRRGSSQAGIGNMSSMASDDEEEDPEEEEAEEEVGQHGAITRGVAGLYEGTLSMLGDSLASEDREETKDWETDLSMPATVQEVPTQRMTLDLSLPGDSSDEEMED